MVRVIVVDLLCCVPDLDRRRLSSLAVQQRRRKMWMTLFRECLALFIVTFAESGWAVVVNEQDENFKIQDLERKIFTPARNRVMCEALLKEAQKDPTGAIGKSIVFAVNQKHATNLTKIFNEIQPGLAVTSRLASQTHRPSLRSSETANALNRLLSLWTCCPPDTTAETYSTSSNATYLFSDRIYSDQGTRYSPIHFQERSYRVRKEKLFPSRFLRRRGVLRGEIRPLGRA